MSEELVEVRLLDLPVRIYRRAAEHNDELLREFALIRDQHENVDSHVPGRLLTLMEELQERFDAFTAQSRSALQEAMWNNRDRIDLIYRIPPEAKQAVKDLDALLDETDEYCRSGEELLTLATPADALALRHWFLGQFVAQMDGEAPTPWSEAPH